MSYKLQVTSDKSQALGVMLQNPAVLQCGASLATQPASQIKRFAAFRSAIDKSPTGAPVAVLGTLAALLLFVGAGKSGALPVAGCGTRSPYVHMSNSNL